MVSPGKACTAHNSIQRDSNIQAAKNIIDIQYLGADGKGMIFKIAMSNRAKLQFLGILSQDRNQIMIGAIVFPLLPSGEDIFLRFRGGSWLLPRSPSAR
jgi:hypothetical protein